MQDGAQEKMMEILALQTYLKAPYSRRVLIVRSSDLRHGE